MVSPAKQKVQVFSNAWQVARTSSPLDMEEHPV